MFIHLHSLVYFQNDKCSMTERFILFFQRYYVHVAPPAKKLPYLPVH